MKSINWNQMSKLGLIERINREILHPLGLAIARDVTTGISEKVLVAPDGIFEYGEIKSTIISEDEINKILDEYREVKKCS
ncbi:hypothetical protein CKQ84_22180 [Shewanella sp. WE21]|uniref:DUF7415 domain-containing protein n=1 Tax=Shewanella TaxID=22 RepID=UPI000CF717CA|nr:MULTISPECIES: hypothetical protein [Shewanella]AVI68323.1 hypothetical protein CKQ84_22180 [Shewanella sp. WE21]MCS6101396.1 hypothetical protein [Shewanella baltica]MCS6184484.1 hypothetical protein [Shewanella baltica]